MLTTRREVERAAKDAKGTRAEIPVNGMGLYLQVLPSGVLSWVMRYQNTDGKMRKRTIGRVNLDVNPPEIVPVENAHLSLDDALRLWSQLRAEVKGGKDKTPKRLDPSLSDLSFAVQSRQFIERWLRDYKRNKTWMVQANALGWDYTGDAPTLIAKGLAERWQNKLVTSITKPEIKSIIEAAREKGIPGRGSSGEVSDARAYEMFTVLNVLFKWLMEEDRITHNPTLGIRRPNGAEERTRVLSDEELVTIWDASYAHHNQIMGAWLRFLIVTGQRRDEVADMKWTEIKGNVWTIPVKRDRMGKAVAGTKNDKATAITLTPFAFGLLPKPKAEFVFTTDGKKPFSGFSKYKAQIDKITGPLLDGEGEGWRFHDLRRTMATGLERLDTPLQVTEKALNHSERSGSKRGLVGLYQRRDYSDKVADAFVAWSNHVERLVVEKLALRA